MELATKYNPQNVEGKWYDYWMKNGYFFSKPDNRKPYTIVIPPPNVTGVLHMGHMLNNTIQDVLIRRARMRGFNACWVPGTDHASIATEAKVVAKLKEEGISKFEIGREKFLEHAWEWTHKHGGIILEQLKTLGCSCDWNRTKFTMDPELSESVTKVFVDLYNKGLIYRGYRMVNWDPEAKTNISDEEVNYQEKQGKLYFLRYFIEGTEDYIVVATTRPETIFGDTAVCINPNDERYQHLKGKRAIVPIVNRSVPIIEDEYVDIEFGTGCLKVTPAHDVNDYELGQKHDLEIIDSMNDDGTLNHHAMHYAGKDRFKVRKEIESELESKGLLEKVENYTNKVGTSERTGAVIEPKLSVQWFLKMKEIAKPALENVMNDRIQFHPSKFKNTYKHWMENVHDWNISRQLWWGHQIPAFYYGDGDDFVVALNKQEALEIIKRERNLVLTEEDLRQDEDALDTWFSSWLWPISVFNGINEPENEEINYYYPTQDLVTAPEIMFFWVARMIIAGYEYRNEYPFKNVYFTGIVRDKLGRKMSKSLGNSPDPIELMKQYGADGVRMGMLLSSPAGNDLPFDEELCVQGRNFANKVWNAFRLIKGWEVDETLGTPEASQFAMDWFEAKFNATLEEIEGNYEKYRISDVLMSVYKLIWDDFCSWYLEAVKPEFGKPIDAKTYQSTIQNLENCLKILHPFMPFLTEEIWQLIEERTPENALIVAAYPELKIGYSMDVIKAFETTSEIISGVRAIRNEKGISPKEQLELYATANSLEEFNSALVEKLGNVIIKGGETFPEKGFTFRVGTFEFLIPVSENIDLEAEKEKLMKEKEYLEGFLNSVRKKLSNEKFVNGAPEAVVNAERKKEADALAKIAQIEEQLKSF